MSTLSRRRFFQELGFHTKDAFASAAKDISRLTGKTEKMREEIKEFAVGRIGDFPVRSKQMIEAKGLKLEISSETDGLKARLLRSDGDVPIPMRLGTDGFVYALPAERCGPCAVFSLFTGEMIQDES